MNRAGTIFLLLLLFGVTSAALMTIDVTLVVHSGDIPEILSMLVLWSDVGIEGVRTGLQLGIGILSLLLFVTVFAILTYREVD